MEDFWESVDKRDFHECWFWLAAKDKDGYGIYDWRDRQKGQTRRTNRIAWELTNGPIPDGLFILHSCDETSCCNPAHLWAGTAKENTQDAIQKGRWSNPPRMVGEANPGGGKLIEQNVREIRRLHAIGDYTLVELGEMFGVTFGMIGHIVNRRAWKHVE